MKIVFDGAPVCPEQLTGIGMHEKEICRALIRLHPENEYAFNYFSLKDKAGKKQRMKAYEADNVKTKSFPLLTDGMYKLVYGIIPIPYKWLFRGKQDITHFFNFIIPPGVKGKKVCTIHDLAFRRYPETVALKTRKMLEYRLGSTVKRADHIFVVSEFTKKELNELYKVPEEKMTVLYAGVDFGMYRRIERSAETDALLNKAGVTDGNYFFYLGTLEPRKNLTRLMGAYAETAKRLTAEGKTVPDLVLGGKAGWYYGEIFDRIEKEGISGKVKRLGYISDEEKSIFYARARAFVFPSLYEGFGMPVAEAMACGAPVLTSNVSSLPEVTGGNAVECDPLSEKEIADGLYSLSTDDELCRKLSYEGEAWSKRFTWEATAEKMYQVYKEILKK